MTTGNGNSFLKSWLAGAGTKAMRLLPPEVAHDLAIKSLKQPWAMSMLPGEPKVSRTLSLGCELGSIGYLNHPIGLAAGFDKNAEVIGPISAMGFSLIEVGTITPRPQRGNPKPRLFRYPEQRAIINRMGFNSQGAEVVSARIPNSARYGEALLGINVGKNKLTPPEKAIYDYLQGIETFAKQAEYLVVNISSPNTEGLRDLASGEFVRLLAKEAPDHVSKIWIKLDPDMPKKDFQQLVEAISGEKFGGVVLSNTHKVQLPETGGLSGHPLMSMSNRILEWALEVHQGSLPTIASGGVLSGFDVVEKVRRGASAVQIYTALIYRGPYVVHEMIKEMEQEMVNLGIDCLSDIKGTFYQ